MTDKTKQATRTPTITPEMLAAGYRRNAAKLRQMIADGNPGRTNKRLNGYTVAELEAFAANMDARARAALKAAQQQE